VPVIIAAVFLAFFPTFANDFVLWDDDVNFLENLNYRGLSPAHLRWMFTTFHMGPYQPLSWVTLGLDYVTWGMNPFGYHLTNLVLHVMNAVLLFLLIGTLLLRLWPDDSRSGMLRLAAAAGALFFALHPLRVESVAWATERRDVLSGLFYILTLIFYLRRDEAASPMARCGWYLATLLAFVAGLLSKASGVTLPVVLFLLSLSLRSPRLSEISPRHSPFTILRSLLSLLPFFLLSFIFGLLAVYGQRTQATMLAMEEHGIVDRLMQCAYGLCFYVGKTLVPIRLSPLYLREHFGTPLDANHIMSAAAVAVLTLALLFGRRQRGALTAWLSYVILVLPVAGVAQAGAQIAADRYTYLPTMPFAVLVAGGVAMLERRRSPGIEGQVGRGVSPSRRGGSPGGLALPVVGRWALGVGCSILLTILGILSFRQTQIWHDTLSLWSHALAIDPANYLAYNNRGNHHEMLGDVQAAMADYDAAIAVNPEYAISYSNRGNLRQKAGDLAGALADQDKAIALQKKPMAKAYNNRANVHQLLGNRPQALSDYATAVRLKPDLWEAYVNRARLLIELGDRGGAVRDYDMAINLKPDDVSSWINRGFALMRSGRHTEALANFDVAIRLDPRIPITYLNRGIVRRNLNDNPGAAQDFKKALSLAPPDWSYSAEAQRYLQEFGNR